MLFCTSELNSYNNSIKGGGALSPINVHIDYQDNYLGMTIKQLEQIMAYFGLRVSRLSNRHSAVTIE
jgi:hypothetical protein